MSTFLDQMRQHRAEAVAARDRLDARIAALDVLIAQEQGTDAVPVSVKSAVCTPHTQRYTRTMAEAVLEAMDGSVEPVPFTAIFDAVTKSLGSANEKSLRGTLPRMEKAGQIRRVARGLYALRTNAETPAATGVSDGNTPSSREGGGSRETTEAPASAAEDQHHPQLGASITEVAS